MEHFLAIGGIIYLFQIAVVIAVLSEDRFKYKAEIYISIIPFFWVIVIAYYIIVGIYNSGLIKKFKKLK